MNTVLMVGATLLLLATLAGLVRHNHWGFRVFDFPRLQWIALILLVDGLANGAVYLLAGLGLVLIFSVTRVVFVPFGDIAAFAALSVLGVV